MFHVEHKNRCSFLCPEQTGNAEALMFHVEHKNSFTSEKPAVLRG
jgi:hypothetical protein